MRGVKERQTGKSLIIRQRRISLQISLVKGKSQEEVPKSEPIPKK